MKTRSYMQILIALAILLLSSKCSVNATLPCKTPMNMSRGTLRCACPPDHMCVGRRCHTATHVKNASLRVEAYDEDCLHCKCISADTSKHGRVLMTYLLAAREPVLMRQYLTFLSQSLPYIVENVLQYHPHYELAIFYTNFTMTDEIFSLRSMVASRTKMHFVDVTHLWVAPEWARKAEPHSVCHCGDLQWPLDYCVMNEFFLRGMFTLPIIDDFTYFFRLDSDTHVSAPFPEDPADIATLNNYDFLHAGYSDDTFEYAPCIPGMCDMLQQKYPSITEKGYKCGITFQGQFMFGRVSWFKTPEFSAFVAGMLGGVYQHRWADQDLVPAAFYAVGDPGRAHKLLWVDYLVHTKAVPLSKDSTPPHRSGFFCDSDSIQFKQMKPTTASIKQQIIDKFVDICEWRNVCIRSDFGRNPVVYAKTAPSGMRLPFNGMSEFGGEVPIDFHVIRHDEFFRNANVTYFKLPGVVHYLCCTQHVTHYMMDDLMPIAYMLLRRNISARHVVYLNRDLPVPYMTDMRDYLLRAFPGSESNPNPSETPRNMYITEWKTPRQFYCFEKLYISRKKFSLGTTFAMQPHPLNFSQIRDVIRYLAPIPDDTQYARQDRNLRIVIAERTGYRKFRNANVLAEALREHPNVESVDVVVFQEISVLAAVELMKQCDVYIYVHGAGMTNTLFLPQNATVLTVYPPHLKDFWNSLNEMMMDIARVSRKLAWVATESRAPPNSYFFEEEACEALRSTPEVFIKIKQDPNYLPLDHPHRVCSVQYWNDQSVVLNSTKITKVLFHRHGHVAQQAAQ